MKLFHRVWRFVAVMVVITGAASGQSFAQASPFFDDATAAAGITTPHHKVYFITGQAWGDVNRDGWLDLYLTDSSGANRIYLNNRDGTFSIPVWAGDVELSAATSGGAVFGDYDNDGWLDLYVANLGENTLFHNQTGTGFADVTPTAGVGDIGRGETAAWGDFDGDGLLDLYVANRECAACANEDRDVLYHNNGDGTFDDVTGLLGSSAYGLGFSVVFLDYDNDADLDIYVVNDKLDGNRLWRNDGPGCGGWCFEDVSASSGAGFEMYSMGIAVGDFDADDDLDLVVSNIGPPVFLESKVAQGNPVFVDAAAAVGVDFDAISWGALFFDYDNDGWLDLYLALMNDEPDKGNRLFHNTGLAVFEDVSAGSGADHVGATLGVATADYDNDGLPDLVIGNWNVDYRLLRNNGSAATGNHWLTVRPVGGGPVNRDGIGTRVELSTSDGRQQFQELKSGSSLGAGNEIALHFGYGAASITGVTVRWPDGLIESLSAAPADSIWRIFYPVPRSQIDSRDLAEVVRAGHDLGFIPATNPDPTRDGATDAADLVWLLGEVFQ